MPTLAIPCFRELSSMVRKITGIDQLFISVIPRLGNHQATFLPEDYAKGRDTEITDLILIGEVDREQLNKVFQETGRYIHRKTRPLVLSLRT